MATTQKTNSPAFFVGKLNKTHDREQLYSALRRLGAQYNFYINKLDMPYGKAGKRGNKGYAFVHVQTQEEADRIIALRYIQLCGQKCEVKAYGGRDFDSSPTTSNTSSGYTTPVEGKAWPIKREKVDLQKLMAQKAVATKEQDWAEESDDPAGYYSDSEVFEDVQSKVATDTQVSEAYQADNVWNYVHQELKIASSSGDAVDFLQRYFAAYEQSLQKLQSMSPEELQVYAKQYADVTTIVAAC